MHVLNANPPAKNVRLTYCDTKSVKTHSRLTKNTIVFTLFFNDTIYNWKILSNQSIIYIFIASRVTSFLNMTIYMPLYYRLDKIDLNPVTIFTSIKTSQTFLDLQFSGVRVKVMVFKTTFNNISVISWWSVLLVEETGVPGDNH